ncbi:ABC-type hemin transport system, ATPase component [Candidatus Rhodobacter oscarellae]|uniref:ABC-type hemin transport system, ATPase component n=1 Tax=Candidatus Rhodobacter oscarellae TaxID=1675527 RepID=A0A0J9E7G3_9RHOB|nr:heme ABC transporter ATP-binding protein [Candidatus Rhodobacter lobularis]KMW57729.1 ABC-type hemin transport system, ATPase component [Candidatus Rhodobacter lobularis]
MSFMASGIRVSYGRKEVLHGVDFVAQPGEVTAIIGPNGSGKSTLMKALTAELRYTGQVTLEGDDIQDVPAPLLAGRRAVLPQSVSLTFPFTAREVVEIGLSAGISGDRSEVVLQALARVGLADHADSFYQELSGGQQQRVQCARVLAQVWQPVVNGVPRWLLLDEPVSSLDIAHQVAIMDIAAQYASEGGGVIAVMHDLNLTAHYANAACLIHQGRVVRRGKIADVLEPDLLSEIYHCTLRAVPNGGSAPLLSPVLS